MGSIWAYRRQLGEPTMTIERRMKPAAEASLAGSGEYTKVFTMAVAYVRPAARNPTIWRGVSTGGISIERDRLLTAT